MSDDAKKIFSSAYLKDKVYNDIVLHMEREMRLNGLGAIEEVSLVQVAHRPSESKTRQTEVKR